MTTPAGPARPFRSGRVPRVLVAVAAVAATATSFLAASAPADAAVGSYVKAVRTCPAATRTSATCFAMKLVPAAKGQPGARPAAARPARAAATVGPAGGYTPAALAKAYGVDPTVATGGITVGIVDAYDDPNVRPDLNAFDAQYGFPAETTSSLRVVNQRGATSPLPTANAGWASEITLDVDAVRGMCRTCKILLVEADSNSFSDLAIAENKAVALGAKIVTNSFGGAESSTPPASFTTAFKHPGVVITASTGDNGFFDWDRFNTGGSSSNAPAIPAALPTVVAVGGTTLDLDDTGARANESVWNSDGPRDIYGYNLSASLGASGGGCSTLFAVPAWQKTVANYAKTGCGTKRMVGDISALADPFTGYDVYDTYQSTGWQTYGGTSLASPLVAAMWALAGGSGGVDYPAKTLYANFAAGPASYDVRVGSNGACGGASTTSCAGFFGGSPNVIGSGRLDCAWQPAPSTALQPSNAQCYAKVGYDGPSGIGTPNGLATFALG